MVEYVARNIDKNELTIVYAPASSKAGEVVVTDKGLCKILYYA